MSDHPPIPPNYGISIGLKGRPGIKQIGCRIECPQIIAAVARCAWLDEEKRLQSQLNGLPSLSEEWFEINHSVIL